MPRQYSGDVAIIGMSGAFPGAGNLAAYFTLLCEGREAIQFSPAEENVRAKVAPPNWVPAVAAMEDVDRFDASFFGMTAREASITDPQHRILLEHCWRCGEHAGYDFSRFDRPVGVYAGATTNTYLIRNLLANRDIMENVDTMQLNIANGHDFLATRVSYKLGLRGPSHTVQSACSTSLVAVHCACRSLLDLECDMAFAGGVSINMDLLCGYRYQDGGILSPDGHCRAFDAEARGTIFGSGVGVVLLKRLEDAQDERDSIHAVIKGSAVNNDGGIKAGYTAPGVEGQAEVVAEAICASGMDAEDIGYIECHGTGTPLGDSVEVRALTKAFSATTHKRGFCAVGSVKSNVGHLDAAAGVTGLLKTVLSLKSGMLLPSLHCPQPNPQIGFSETPFYVNTHLQPWLRGEKLRTAGVSAFGVGGTNAHVVVQEYVSSVTRPVCEAVVILPVSARTPEGLRLAIANLAAHLREEQTQSLTDIAFTLATGRKQFPFRWATVVTTREGALACLDHASETGAAGRKIAGSLSFSGWQVSGGVPGLYGPGVDIPLRGQPSPACDRTAVLLAAARQWCGGATVDWIALQPDDHRVRVALPGYPFERKRYWIEPTSSAVRLSQVDESAFVSNAEAQFRPRPDLRNHYVAPQDPVTRRAVAILEETLGVRPVGVTDSFGDLGGDSLSAVRIIDQFNSAFGSHLQVVDLYEGLSVVDLVRLLDKEAGREEEAEFVPDDSRRRAHLQSRR